MPPPVYWQRVRVPVVRNQQQWAYENETTLADMTYDTRDEWRLVFTSGAAMNTTASTVTIPAGTLYTTDGTYLANSTAATLTLRNDWALANNWRSSYLNYTQPVQGNWTYGIDVGVPIRTPEEQAAYAARVASDLKKKARAVRKAKKLLTEHLTDEQLQSLAEKDYFELESSSGRRYRIYRGIQRNITELDAQGREFNRLCAHSNEMNMPAEDHILVQKLMLETDESGFRKIANHSPIYVPNRELELAA